MKFLWLLRPDRRFNFFNPPAHLCTDTYITEISLHIVNFLSLPHNTKLQENDILPLVWNILLERLKSPNFNNVTSIKSFGFSTLYTTIPHDKQKSRLASIIRNSFVFKNSNRIYKYLVLGHEESYFVKEHSDSKHKYSEDDIIKMLEFLVFAWKVFQQIVGIPMGTNCAPLLADIFIYSYEAEFIQSLLSHGRKQLASRFNFTYRYIDEVLSINNPEFENNLGQMYPVELEIG